MSVDHALQGDLVWTDWEEKADAEENWFDELAYHEQYRLTKLTTQFYGAVSAYCRSPATPENPPSLDNCERSPTSGETDATTALDVELNSDERELLQLVFRMGVDDIDTAARIVSGPTERVTQTIYAALERDQERQWKVLKLLERDEINQAFNLATCGRKSVRLECGFCGCDENYVPTSCDSRLCPDCQDKKIGQNIEKYSYHVSQMDTPVLLTLTTKNVADPISGRDDLVEALGKFRRRSIPFEGSTKRETEDGEMVEKSWSWWEGTRPEDLDEDHEQWKLKLQEQGHHDLVRRLQDEYVNYSWEDITGTHTGRNIPFSELSRGGIYGIDVKQREYDEYNIHAHVLIDLPYVPQAALSAVWEDVTDGACVVDVRGIYTRRDSDSVEEALSETVGYAVKPPEFEDLEDELAWVEAAKGCASVHPFGELHGAGTSSGDLICCDCSESPLSWEYCGTVHGEWDTVGKSWEDRGKDPPAD
jgi:hypothetical protein